VQFVIERLLVLTYLAVLLGIPAWITWRKGQHLAFIVGFFLPGMVWWIVACRLARPSSWWARRFYGPEKMQRAIDRYGPGVPTPA
jgi:hypothetical protein